MSTRISNFACPEGKWRLYSLLEKPVLLQSPTSPCMMQHSSIGSSQNLLSIYLSLWSICKSRRLLCWKYKQNQVNSHHSQIQAVTEVYLEFVNNSFNGIPPSACALKGILLKHGSDDFMLLFNILHWFLFSPKVKPQVLMLLTKALQDLASFLPLSPCVSGWGSREDLKESVNESFGASRRLQVGPAGTKRKLLEAGRKQTFTH